MIAPFPSGRFGVIYADPPWRFATWSAKGRNRCPDWRDGRGNRCRAGAPRHYETMSIRDIMALPVAEFAAKDAVLLLWTTDPMLPAALDVGRAWGATYKTTGFVWVKRTRGGGAWHLGMGHWTRANPELCLLFTWGKPKRRSASVRKLIEAPVREHSRKPDEAYDRIEALCDGPYLELFARPPLRRGWSAWGDEVPADVERAA